jgi:hypothetical protein
MVSYMKRTSNANLIDRLRIVGSITLFLIVLLVASTKSRAGIIGHWTFEAGSLVDSSGNFGDVVLEGNASIVNGELIVSKDPNSSQSPSGWARTNGAYTGPMITSKTLVSWVTLTALSNGDDFGAAISIDSLSFDNFDAIVFAEREANRWLAGSSNFFRTQDFNPGFEETNFGTRVQMAYTYDVIGADVTITGYRDGIQIGQYTTPNAANWTVNDTEILFGPRHVTSGNPIGSLDARIDEARIYNTVLSQFEIAGLTPVTAVPEPSSAVVAIAGLVSLAIRRHLRLTRTVRT